MATTYFDASFTRPLFFDMAEMHGNDVMCLCGSPITFTKLLITVDPEDFKKFVERLYFVCTNGDCPLYKDADPDPYWGGLYYTLVPDNTESGYATALFSYQEKSKQLDMQISALESQKEIFERHKREQDIQLEAKRVKMMEEVERKFAEWERQRDTFMLQMERKQKYLKDQEDQVSYNMSMMLKPPKDRGILNTDEINASLVSIEEARESLLGSVTPPLDGVIAEVEEEEEPSEQEKKAKTKVRKAKSKSKSKSKSRKLR